MELAPRGSSDAPCIKCSNCDIDVPLNEMATHICSQASAILLVEEPEQMPVCPQNSISNPPRASSRPARPRIDSFAVTRAGTHGELTPASSHGSVGHSPISPGAGRRSPFLHPPRKATVPIIRRPPSPELLSQDCAFPPFPSNKNKSKNNNSKHAGRGRTNTPEASQSSKSFEHEAKRSASVGAPRLRFRQGTGDSSRPSTANSSRRPSLSSRIGSRAGSRQGSIDQLPPLPPLQPSLSRTTTSSGPKPGRSEQMDSWSLVPDAAPSKVPISTETSPFSEPSSQDSHQSSSEIPSPQFQEPEPANVQPSSESVRDAAPHEPSYKAKRPPPIENPPPGDVNEAATFKPELGLAPPSTLAKTLTSIFGRKRNQSTGTKKARPKTSGTDGPRFIALSPDPDPQGGTRTDHLSGNSLDIEAATTLPVPGVQDVPQVSADILSIEDFIPEPSRAQILQPDEQGEGYRDSMHIEQELEKSLAAVVTIPGLSTVPEQAEDVKRVSIDSASSYGSEGFSHSRASSRSTNAVTTYSHDSSISTAHTTASSEEFLSPAFAKLRIPDVMPDSPTDPCLQQGRLTPVGETASLAQEEKEEKTWPRLLPVPRIPESEGGQLGSPQSETQRRPSIPGGCRGICRGCSQTIMQGQKSVSSKDGRLTGRYHKECFVCKTCRAPFATADFYVHEDDPYCSHDYHLVNGTLCESCGNGIEGHYLETSNLTGHGTKKFHPHCLKCVTCQAQLVEDYFELGGRVYCEKDAFRLVHGPRSPYGTAPSRPSPLNREYISSWSGEPGQVLAAGKFPERRLTKFMTTY